MKHLLLIIFLHSQSVWGASFTLGAGNGSEADGAYLNFNAKNTNYGAATSLYLGGDSATVGYAHLILNWPAVKDSVYNNTVDACTLFVYVSSNANVDGLYSCYQIRTGRDWTESGVTWNNYKASTPWTTGGGRDVTSDIFPSAVDTKSELDLAAGAYHGFNITSIATQWDGADTAACRGVLIRQMGGSDYTQLTISSDDYATVTQRPKIKVVYHTGTANPATARRRKSLLGLILDYNLNTLPLAQMEKVLP